MVASTTLRLLLGASLGLGALDVAWLDLALAPQATETGTRAPAPGVAALRVTPGDADEPAAMPPAPEPPAPVATPPSASAPAALADQVYFTTQSAALDPTARTLVDRLVHSAGASAVFVLEGHADYRGSEGFNRTLSRDRARAVADYLARSGVPRTRIRVGWVGKDGTTSADALWRDRRVDIHVGGER